MVDLNPDNYDIVLMSMQSIMNKYTVKIKSKEIIL